MRNLHTECKQKALERAKQETRTAPHLLTRTHLARRLQQDDATRKKQRHGCMGDGQAQHDAKHGEVNRHSHARHIRTARRAHVGVHREATRGKHAVHIPMAALTDGTQAEIMRPSDMAALAH